MWFARTKRLTCFGTLVYYIILKDNEGAYRSGQWEPVYCSSAANIYLLRCLLAFFILAAVFTISLSLCLLARCPDELTISSNPHNLFPEFILLTKCTRTPLFSSLYSPRSPKSTLHLSSLAMMDTTTVDPIL